MRGAAPRTRAAKIPAICRPPNRGSQEIPGSPPEGYPLTTGPMPATGSSPNRTGRGVRAPAVRPGRRGTGLDSVTQCRRAAPTAETPDSLAEYEAKRDFDATPEPAGAPAESRRRRSRPTAAAVSSCRSTTPARCTGTSGSSATACSRRGRCRRASRSTRSATTSRCAPRTTRSSTSTFQGEIPRGRVRRRLDGRLGHRHVRDAQVGRRRSDGHVPRRARAREVRAVPHRAASSG